MEKFYHSCIAHQDGKVLSQLYHVPAFRQLSPVALENNFGKLI